MNNEINWKQYRQIRKYLDNLNLDDEVVHRVALRTAGLGLKRIKLSVCGFKAKRKTWRKRQRELTLSDMRAGTGRLSQQAHELEASFAGESVYTTQALDRYERWADMAVVHEMLEKLDKDWGDAAFVSLERAVEMEWPGDDASKEQKTQYKREKERLRCFRKKWGESE